MTTPDEEFDPFGGEEQINPFMDFDNASLLETERHLTEQISQLQEQLANVHDALGAHMNADQAEVLEMPGVKVTFSASRQWMPDSFLREKLLDAGHMTDDEWETILNAPPKPRPRTIDKRKLPALAKRGGVFRQIIEEAQVEGPATLKIKRTTE